jgi:surface protein
MKFNNETIREAVKEWLDDNKLAELKYGHISNWDTSEVTDMSSLFLDAHEFNSPIEEWDVSNVTTMHAMFDNAFRFNKNLNNWNVSKVEDMSEMFSSSEELFFNKPVEKWDVSNVTNMGHMFVGAVSFNQPIEKWDVSNVTDMGGMFSEAVSFNQPVEKWDVSNVTNMEGMFYKAEAFNQPIEKWDVSNVTNMGYMFNGAETFNQPLSKWKLKKLEESEMMFESAFSFKQTLPVNLLHHRKNKGIVIVFNEWMTINTSIKINNDFKISNLENEFKLINYKFNGGKDFNYNIFNNETFEHDEVYVGSPSSSQLTICVNHTILYVKHFDIHDGPIQEGVYLGISLDPEFKNIEWSEYAWGVGGNSDLIDFIGSLSIALRDEDFINDYEELDYYEDFNKIELNIQIDIKKFKENWQNYMG